MSNMNGKWIVVTGLDGSGKTTFKNRLAGYLKSQGHKVQNFKSPFDKHLLGLLDVSGDGLPWRDNYTDQMIFMLDNRMLSYYVRDWREKHEYLVSQRGFIDSFVHGVCRGFSYQETDQMMRTNELEKCDVMIHFNCDPNVAFQRICDDPDADKFETLEYIEKQAKSTKDVYDALIAGSEPSFEAFKDCINIYIDTTHLSMDGTYKFLLKKLRDLKIIE